MKAPSTDTGRLAQASILAVLAAGMLPAQLFGGLLFALEFRRTPMPALTGGGLMFVLAVCNAIAVLLPMALILQSQQRLRRAGVEAARALLPLRPVGQLGLGEGALLGKHTGPHVQPRWRAP